MILIIYSNSERQQVESLLLRDGGKGNEELLFDECRASVLQGEKFLEVCCTAR